jgi:ribosomal silencing factor RsfS
MKLWNQNKEMSDNLTKITSQEDIKQIEGAGVFATMALEFFETQSVDGLYYATPSVYITSKVIIVVPKSPKQIDALSIGFIKKVKENGLFSNKIKIEGNAGREWCIIDLMDLMIHIITPAKLEQYKLTEILKGNYAL